VSAILLHCEINKPKSGRSDDDDAALAGNAENKGLARKDICGGLHLYFDLTGELSTRRKLDEAIKSFDTDCGLWRFPQPPYGHHLPSHPLNIYLHFISLIN